LDSYLDKEAKSVAAGSLSGGINILDERVECNHEIVQN